MFLQNLNLANFGLLKPIEPGEFIFEKNNSNKTRYKIYISKLLAIIKVFKTWMHYFENCKYNFLIFIDKIT